MTFRACDPFLTMLKHRELKHMDLKSTCSKEKGELCPVLQQDGQLSVLLLRSWNTSDEEEEKNIYPSGIICSFKYAAQKLVFSGTI